MKRKHMTAAVMAAVMILSSVPSVSAAGWRTNGGVTEYVRHDGSLVTGVMVIDGLAYNFGADGALKGFYTGIGIKNGRIRYYMNGVSYSGGWLTLSSGTYYFDKNGIAATGIITIDGVQYNFGSDGRLADRQDSFTVTSDSSSFMLGSGQELTFTVTAHNINSTASLGNISELQMMKNGQWYRIKPDSSFAVTEIAYTLGDAGAPSYYVEKVQLKFSPELYKKDLESGRYRIPVYISTSSGKVTKYCEFDIIGNAEITAEKSEYIIPETERINISAVLNREEMVYLEQCPTLSYYDKPSGIWSEIKPKTAASAALVSKPSGSIISTYLDLSRYDRTRMKSGRYRAAVGENLFCEFVLKNPFEADVSIMPSENPRKKQVMVTITNESNADITVKGYGQLYRLEKNKWKKLSMKSGKKADTDMFVPAMHKWQKSMLLNDYYSTSSLKKGSYCMIFPTAGSGYVYAYFDIE